ncbi:hypothetical protein OG21DRAFT_664444 [Imleria badia]|nr:hypothetical protein OG21DRAFT_664444 [Imleria badia]
MHGKRPYSRHEATAIFLIRWHPAVNVALSERYHTCTFQALVMLFASVGVFLAESPGSERPESAVIDVPVRHSLMDVACLRMARVSKSDGTYELCRVDAHVRDRVEPALTVGSKYSSHQCVWHLAQEIHRKHTENATKIIFRAAEHRAFER